MPRIKRIVPDLVRLSVAVERELWSIERQKPLVASVINGLIAGAAVALVAWMFDEGDLLLFACLGSSASAVVFAPMVRANSLRTIIFAYLISALVTALLDPVRAYTDLPLFVQCGAAVAGCVTAMRLLKVFHSAAVGAAMAFVIYERDIEVLAVLLGAILTLLILVKALTYIYLEELEFKDFHREFTRRFRGREVRVSIPEKAQGDASPDAASDGESPPS